MMCLHVYDLFIEPNPEILLNFPINLLISNGIASIAHFVYTRSRKKGGI